jgi:hypothetical protein
MQGMTMVLALTTIFSANAGAEPEREGKGNSERLRQWMKMDADGDGFLTVEETSGLMKRFFERNDTDKDGKLNQQELAALDQRLPANREDRASNRGRRSVIASP